MLTVNEIITQCELTLVKSTASIKLCYVFRSCQIFTLAKFKTSRKMKKQAESEMRTLVANTAISRVVVICFIVLLNRLRLSFIWALATAYCLSECPAICLYAWSVAVFISVRFLSRVMVEVNPEVLGGVNAQKNVQT